jgi:integrase
VATSLKISKAPIFNMPHASNLARMLRADLEDARQAWLEPANDPQGYARREQSDFLAANSHDGETLDFHALRHACGAWLAMAGAHPKTIQTVMRHSAITLTMDTYGHLFPGQEADAVNRLRQMMNEPQIPFKSGS